MMVFSVWFLLLAVLAAAFVAWPLLSRAWKKKERDLGEAEVPDELAQRVAVNDALYDEQLSDLIRQRDSAELTENQFAKLKEELDALHLQDNAMDAMTTPRRRFGHGLWVVGALALIIPAAALFLYTERGAVDDWEIQQLSTELRRLQQRGAEQEVLRATSQALYNKLQNRLEETPENLNNHFLLARTAVELGEFRRALQAYQHILEREPNSPQIMAEMAQVLFMAAGNRMTVEVQQVFDRALKMDPGNTDLLGFAGIGAYQSGKYQLAIDYWQRGMQLLEASDPRHQTWRQAIAEAQRQLGPGSEAGAAAADASGADPVSDQASSLQVTVTLGDRVKASPGDTVFVYARAWKGAKMPLAMQQLKVADLPLTVELHEAMSMVPGMTMSRFPQLEVVARISSSGLADPRPGDWQATAGPIDASSSEGDVKLVIDSQIP